MTTRKTALLEGAVSERVKGARLEVRGDVSLCPKANSSEG